MCQKTNQEQTLQKLNTTPKKQTTQNTAEKNYSSLVASLRYSARKWDGLILQCPQAHISANDFKWSIYDVFHCSTSVVWQLEPATLWITERQSRTLVLSCQKHSGAHQHYLEEIAQGWAIIGYRQFMQTNVLLKQQWRLFVCDDWITGEL